MGDAPTDKFSAGEQGLGYIYQARLALLHLLQLPEDTAVFLEKDDDLDFVDGDGGKSLASLTVHANLREQWFQDALVEIPWAKPPALVPEDWPQDAAN